MQADKAALLQADCSHMGHTLTFSLSHPPPFHHTQKIVLRLALLNPKQNTWRTMPSVLMVVMLELYVILVYACACFLLYGRRGDDLDGPFQELDWSFINLFALSTTVNNPDIWLPMYAQNPWNALVFISFLITILYFIHNLVIATVYEVYSSSLSQHTQKREANRSSALESAFAIMANGAHAVSKDIIVDVLQRLRPHYSKAKVYVLYELVDPDGAGEVPRDSFDNVLTALNTRVRTRDVVESLSAFLSQANLSHFEAALRGAGVTETNDLLMMSDKALMDLGMNEAEHKRLTDPPGDGWMVCSTILLVLNACSVLGICLSQDMAVKVTTGDTVPWKLVSTMVIFAVLLFLDTAQQVRSHCECIGHPGHGQNV